MSGLPREVIRWLQCLDLTHPIRNVRRDFSNGYLIAEVFSWYYPQKIQMYSFSNGASIRTKLGNWQQLEQFFVKESVDIPRDIVEGTIHCKPGAAVALLVRAFTILTKRELRYLPPRDHPSDFSDSTYQCQLPPHARSTAAQSIKNNIARTELTTEPDRIVCMQKAQAIVHVHAELRKQEKEQFPERFGLTASTVPAGPAAVEGHTPTAQLREISVEQRQPANMS